MFLGLVRQRFNYAPGRKITSRFRSNRDGSGGLGRGEERSTAASIDLTTASSPLQRPEMDPGGWTGIVT